MRKQRKTIFMEQNTQQPAFADVTNNSFLAVKSDLDESKLGLTPDPDNTQPVSSPRVNPNQQNKQTSDPQPEELHEEIKELKGEVEDLKEQLSDNEQTNSQEQHANESQTEPSEQSTQNQPAKVIPKAKTLPHKVADYTHHEQQGTPNHILEKSSDPNKQKIAKVAKESNRELYRLKNVFPFDLFPDEIIIRENKVTIIYNEFFASGQVRSFDISEIIEVSIDTNPFFATMRLLVKTFAMNNEYKIYYLKRAEAEKARRIIEGLTTLKEEKVDFSEIHPEEVASKAEEASGVHV